MSEQYNGASASLLHGGFMPATIGVMPKTQQVRLPVDLLRDLDMIASAFGESVPEYAARKLREAASKDLLKAAKIVAKRAEQASASTEETE